MCRKSLLRPNLPWKKPMWQRKTLHSNQGKRHARAPRTKQDSTYWRIFQRIFQNGTSNGSPMYSYNNDEFLKANGKTIADCDFECEYLFGLTSLLTLESNHSFWIKQMMANIRIDSFIDILMVDGFTIGMQTPQGKWLIFTNFRFSTNIRFRTSFELPVM